MTRRPLPVLRQAIALCALALSSCRPPQEQTLALDLLDEFPRMETRLETAVIDLTAGGADVSLLRGFSKPRRGGRRDLTSVRSRGRQSIVRFEVLEARDLVLTLRARAMPRGGRGTVEIAVRSGRKTTSRASSISTTARSPTTTRASDR